MVRRNDIMVMVTTSGEMLIAQGSSLDILLGRDDVADYERNLYYSQVPHRAAILVAGKYRIVKPSEYPTARKFVRCKLGGGKIISLGVA